MKIDLRAESKISDTSGMSQEPLVTEELIARQPPESQAIIRLLLAKIAELGIRKRSGKVRKRWQEPIFFAAIQSRFPPV